MQQYLCVTCVVFASMLTSCNSNSTASIKNFIPGSYIRPIDSEFAIGQDSLVLHEEGHNHYIITRYSTFSRIQNEKKLPEEKHVETWAGSFDETDKVIHEFQGGKIIHFNPDKRILLVGSSVYTKIE